MKTKVKKFVSLALMGLVSQGVVFASANWMENFEDAKAKAKAENRFMLLDFTGSDWCGWCIKLDNEVFSKSDFEKYAAEKLVLVEIDSPRRKKLSDDLVEQNTKLKKEFGITGFPTILILDPNGEKIGRTGYKDGGPKKYVEHLEQIIQPYASKFGAASGGGGGGSVESAVNASAPRTWTSSSGSTIDASYYRIVGNVVELKKPNGKQIRIGLPSLSDSDHEFLRSIKAIQ